MSAGASGGIDGSFFPFGGTYAPVVKAMEVGQEHWDEDLRSFKAEGFSAVRGWIPWDRMETKEGARDFRAPELLLELSEKHGLKVMLNIGGVFDNLLGLYPPRWLIGRCQAPRPPGAAAGAPSGPRRSICLNDPLYREKARHFLEEAVARFSRSKALFAWGVWNEPGWGGCSCPHCVALFRKWLEVRYCSVDELNARWGTEFPVLYEGFSDIEPPPGVGFLEGGYSAWLDWNEFMEDTLAGSLRWIHEIVKRYDPLMRPTTTNLTPGDVLGAAPKRHANPSKIGRVVDVLGFSHYTYSQQDARDFALRLDRIRSASKTDDCWIIETESGPVYWVHGRMPGHTRVADRILRYWQAVGKNVSALFFWLYRTRMTDAQSGEFGLRAWDGSPTDRSAASGKMSAFLQRNAARFHGRSVPREIAIWSSAKSMWLGAAEGYEDVPDARKRYWSRSARGAYHMAWDLGFRVDFVDELTPRERILGYGAILIPFCPSVDGTFAELLEQYAASGGLVVADFPFGFKSEHGQLWGRNPGAGLDRVFGCYSVDAVPAAEEDGEIALSLAGGQSLAVKPGTFLQTFTVSPSAQTIGRCSAGGVVVSNACGRGRTILFGTMFFAAYDEELGDARERREALRSLLASHGVLPRYSVSAAAGETGGRLEVCPLVKRDDQDDLLCIVANHDAVAVRYSLLLRGAVESALDLHDGGPLEIAPRASADVETEIRGRIDAASAVVAAIRLKR